MDNRNKNNQVQITGEVITNFIFDYEVHGEGFYKCFIRVPRISGAFDQIPIMVSDRLVEVSAHWLGNWITVTGRLQAYNLHEGGRNKVKIYVFAKEVEALDTMKGVPQDQNRVILNGFLCKKPTYRKTPLGREITDLVFAVNREYGNSDYIPCICWGRNARYVVGLDVGTCLTLEGRIQSREYIKKLEDGCEEQRTAYEVSVSIVREPEQETHNECV